MRIGDAFPGDYLKAEDLHGKSVTLTIQDVAIEQLGSDEKPCVSFKGTKKKLALNKTNFQTIVDLLGEEDTDDWTGKKITLIPAKTEFQGRRVACIRILDHGTPSSAMALDSSAKEKPVEQEELADDDIPF